jgi:hypothetical protein
MKIIETKVYSFDELSPEAQEKALNKLCDLNVNYDWWEFEYEDAERIGLKITGFDLDRGDYCNGEFIHDACYTANKIKEEHGEECETYKTADNFLRERDELVDTAEKDENGDFADESDLDDKLDESEEDFLKSILEDYLSILKKEYEYRTSKEAVIETIQSNDYAFTEDGELF